MLLHLASILATVVSEAVGGVYSTIDIIYYVPAGLRTDFVNTYQHCQSTLYSNMRSSVSNRKRFP